MEEARNAPIPESRRWENGDTREVNEEGKKKETPNEVVCRSMPSRQHSVTAGFAMPAIFPIPLRSFLPPLSFNIFAQFSAWQPTFSFLSLTQPPHPAIVPPVLSRPGPREMTHDATYQQLSCGGRSFPLVPYSLSAKISLRHRCLGLSVRSFCYGHAPPNVASYVHGIISLIPGLRLLLSLSLSFTYSNSHVTIIAVQELQRSL